MVDEFIENELPFLDRINKRKARDTIDEGRESLQFPKRDPLTISREKLEEVSQFIDKAGFEINVPRMFAGFRKPTLQEELDRANRRRH